MFVLATNDNCASLCSKVIVSIPQSRPIQLQNSYFILLTDLSLDHSDLVAELLKELSNHNERIEERKIALYELMKLTQEESFSVWDEHFKTILLLLLETLGDKEVNCRIYKLYSACPAEYSFISIWWRTRSHTQVLLSPCYLAYLLISVCMLMA